MGRWFEAISRVGIWQGTGSGWRAKQLPPMGSPVRPIHAVCDPEPGGGEDTAAPLMGDWGAAVPPSPAAGAQGSNALRDREAPTLALKTLRRWHPHGGEIGRISAHDVCPALDWARLSQPGGLAALRSPYGGSAAGHPARPSDLCVRTAPTTRRREDRANPAKGDWILMIRRRSTRSLASDLGPGQPPSRALTGGRCLGLHRP
jgi:hypothetical protein